MRVGRQIAAEQPVDPGAAELARRQADAVHDDQIRLDARAGAHPSAATAPGAPRHQARRRFDFQWRLHAAPIMPQSPP